MSPELTDIVAGFTVTIFFGAPAYFILLLFGVTDGLHSISPRLMNVRITILIGIFISATFITYIIKPLIYKIYNSLD